MRLSMEPPLAHSTRVMLLCEFCGKWLRGGFFLFHMSNMPIYEWNNMCGRVKFTRSVEIGNFHKNGEVLEIEQICFRGSI